MAAPAFPIPSFDAVERNTIGTLRQAARKDNRIADNSRFSGGRRAN